MQKNKIENRLNELKDCKVLEFRMCTGDIFQIPTENIFIYPQTEFIDAPQSNFRTPYQAVLSIHPVV